MLNMIKKFFGFDGVGETALNIVNKIAGTDWQPKDQADFILRHAEITKYQSPTRRALAVLIALQWFLMGLVWLVSKIIHRMAEHVNAGLLSSDIQAYMASDVNILMNALIGFYFLVGVKK